MSAARILPTALIHDVEQYATGEIEDAAKYENRQPLDYSGVYSLHRLAASIYAQGWADGESAATERERGQRQRERDAARRAEGDQ